MNYRDSLKAYLDDLASRKPAPGGGSASALVGALGLGLISMVANFTIGNEKYKDVEEEISVILDISERLRGSLQELVDRDVSAYGKLSTAYKLPKSTAQEKHIRKETIRAALKEAMQVPLLVCQDCFEAIKLCPVLLEKGNINLVSDVGVAAEFLSCAFESALLNVEINLSQIRDQGLSNETKSQLFSKSKEISVLKEQIVKFTKEIINK